MEVNKSITKIRKEKGYSQTEIAELLKTTQQQYSKYERGEQEIPVRHIKTLCEFYKVTANKLIGIDIYMTEKESSNKFLKFHEEIIDLMGWAYDNKEITEQQLFMFIRYINEIKEEIENK